jgi:glycerol kinase
VTRPSPGGHILAIDQGTTGTHSLLFDERGRVVGRGYKPFRQYFPQPGWVEHDPEEIWKSCLDVIGQALRGQRVKIAAIGITNQRETTILWDRKTGKPVHRAIVWQDRRTAPDCARLRKAGALAEVRRRTGLLLDPYFSGTKLAWLLREVPGARTAAHAGRLAFGTIDTWLIWKLTGGRAHVTDPTNASRTLCFNLARREWDDSMLRLLGVPRAVLPEVRPSAGEFGKTVSLGVLPAGVPVTGVAGDQQAALFGQGCVRPGEMKVTYGTGGFLLLQTGPRLVRSRAGLLTTVACGPAGEATYALEGSVFIAGAVIQWLRDELKLISSAAESEAVARSVPDTAGVHLVPAFTGLGAPWWDAAARGTITGLTRGAGRAHLVRAALESIAFQVADVVDAMRRDLGRPIRALRVDGGACANGLLMQFQSDLVDAALVRPKLIETTAAGAAGLAGIGARLWTPSDLARLRPVDRVFRPHMGAVERRVRLGGWHLAVARARLAG